MKVYYPQNYNDLLLFYFAQYQRTLNKYNPNDPIAFFEVHNIDFKTLLDLYPEQFPQRISDCYAHSSNSDKEELIIPSHHFNVHSKLIQHHKEFSNYGILFEKLNAKQISEREYHDNIRILNNDIINDIRAKFERAVLCTTNSRKGLMPHIDTLLFVCIYFYNTIWDADGLTFNGSVAVDNKISDLTINEQPYHYRLHNRAKKISELLYDYYCKQAPPSHIYFVANGNPHDFKDPLLTQWMIESLIDSIKLGRVPIGFDYMGNELTHLIKLKDKISEALFLERLKSTTEIESQTHIDEKRKAVWNFCWAIHQAFTHYLGLEINSFNNKRSKIYHNILTAFQMDDFTKYRRQPENEEGKSSRTDAATNRLSELLRRGLKDFIQNAR